MQHDPFPAAVNTIKRGERRKLRWRAPGLLGISIACCFSNPVAAADTNELEDAIKRIKDIPFEELVGIEITSVSKRSERLVEAPSAVQVITAEEIHRSGAASLPEALRLAPNLQVAQVNSREWAISARGFNSTTANKLLVLIDGRTVYTPLFSGVFWDVQHVLLEDVERIEVISGPGATLWGANAVNGVINVISKSADKTQGTEVNAGAGSFLRDFGSVRYGSKIGEDVYFRVYGMGFERDSTLFRGRDATNEWALGQAGFRGDWLPKHGDKLTVQGDFYGGNMEQVAPGDSSVNGQNILSRWTRPVGDESEIAVRAYWDRTWRRVPNFASEELNTYDVDLQHSFPIGERQKMIWGVNYRFMADRVNNSRVLAFLPANQNLQLVSAFAQDEITLLEDQLFLTLGSKFEHNDYSGFEIQPSGRIAWIPATNQMFWSAVSRAVRSPSRIDTEVFAPGTAPYALRGGGNNFDSETVVAYELGYRTEVTRRLGVSLSTFFNDYDHIRSAEPIPGRPGQSIILNGLQAETYGVEVATTLQICEPWRLRGGYTFFRKHISLGNSSDPSPGISEGNDPHHQFLIQSMVNLPAHFEFDAVLRYVDNLNQRGPTVPSYMSLDLRVGWRPSENWEISLVGQNLLDDQHPEFGRAAMRQEIPRSIYGKVTWRF